MKLKSEQRKNQKNVVFNDNEELLIKKATKILNTTQSELIREALIEFYTKRGIRL